MILYGSKLMIGAKKAKISLLQKECVAGSSFHRIFVRMDKNKLYKNRYECLINQL